MATSRATPTPRKPKASFSVAAAEKEWSEKERPEPFTVELLSGEIVTLRDPETLGWQQLAGLNAQQPWLVLQTVVEPDDLDRFYAEDFKGVFVNNMIEAYREHYGLLDSGE